MHCYHKAVDFIRKVLAEEHLPMELRAEAEGLIKERADNLATEAELVSARDMYQTDDCEVDEGAMTSRGDEGTWVNAWVWIGLSEAEG